MARTSITHLVLFLAVVSAAAIGVGVLVTEAGLYAQAIDDESDREQAALETDLTIINDPEAGSTYDADSETITLYVKNVGGRTLEPDALDLLVDGEYVSDGATERTVVDDDRWREGAVLEVTVDRSLETGSHRIVATLDGARSTLEFTHREVVWLADQPPATCADGECTVVASEENLTLTMGTDPVQDGVDVTYSIPEDTREEITLTRTAGTTNADGENATVLSFEDLAAEDDVDETVRVTVDAGWDTDELLVRIVSENDG